MARYSVENTQRYLHYLPNTFRCLINGSSGSGKTNVLLNILSQLFKAYDDNNIPFHFILCTKTLEQPLYEGFIKETRNNYKNATLNATRTISTFNECFFDELDKSKKLIIVIDDMVGQINKHDKNALIHLFTTSRPRNISLFFLTQRYTQLDIICRQQLNYLITFKQSLDDLKKIYNEHLSFLPSIKVLENKFRVNINYFCLFCDLEKSTVRDCIDIFQGKKEFKYIANVNDMIEKLLIIDGELNAGNDSDDLMNEMKNLLVTLERMELIKVYY